MSDFRPTPEQDARMARLARRMAEVLRAVAKERREEDKKRLAVLQHELCQLYTKELETPPISVPPTVEASS